MTLLDFERSNVASISANHRSLEGLASSLREDGSAGATKNVLRHKLADVWVTNEIGRLLSYRIAWMQETGKLVNVEASVIKIMATEVAQKISNLGVNLLGPHGALITGSKHARLDGAFGIDHMDNV
jgi:alkylation response protein AidB-like acyl-CoA dehydrogenase